MTDTLEYTAQCTACPARYVVAEPAQNRKRAAAKVRNREVWMQHHTDTAKHTRFEISDMRHRHVIMRWTPSDGTAPVDPQMSIAEDDDYELLEIRSCTPAPPGDVQP